MGPITLKDNECECDCMAWPLGGGEYFLALPSLLPGTSPKEAVVDNRRELARACL